MIARNFGDAGPREPDPCEAPTVFKETRPKALHDHTCDLCKKPIYKGSTHRKLVYVDHENGRQLVTVRSHFGCSWA